MLKLIKCYLIETANEKDILLQVLMSACGVMVVVLLSLIVWLCFLTKGILFFVLLFLFCFLFCLGKGLIALGHFLSEMEDKEPFEAEDF